MQSLRNRVRAHIKELCLDHGEVQEPMHRLAERIGVSVATVHRALKDMENEHMIKVIPSVQRTKPNTIVYIGDPTTEEPKISKVSAEFRTALVSELVHHLKRKQQVIDVLNIRLKDYQNLEVIDRVQLPHNIEVIFRQKGEGHHYPEPRRMERARAGV